MTVIAFIGFILLILHLIEPQCSNATDSEVHLTANSRQCMEELEHYPSDCNNSSAMTSELPLSDESKQWIAQDTCSGRDAFTHRLRLPDEPHWTDELDSADTCYMHKFTSAVFRAADDRQMRDEQYCNYLRQMIHDRVNTVAIGNMTDESHVIDVAPFDGTAMQRLNELQERLQSVMFRYENENHFHSQPCSTAPTPTAEPQASATPTDTPTVKGMDV